MFIFINEFVLDVIWISLEQKKILYKNCNLNVIVSDMSAVTPFGKYSGTSL